MKISLTFDNGPEASVTPRVLETLARFGVQATFFIVGQNIAKPAVRKISERAYSEGHRIGNHSFTHSTPFGLLGDPEAGINELIKTDRLLGELVGEERLYRPFGGGEVGRHLLNRPTWELLAEREYTCVLWDFVAPERLKPDSWMEPALQACLAREWTVLVMHDTDWGGTAHLPAFLQRAIDAGAEFSQDFPDHCVPMRRGRSQGAPELLMP